MTITATAIAARARFDQAFPDFLARVAAGEPIGKACKAAGLVYSTIAKLCSEEPDLAARFAEAKRAARLRVIDEIAARPDVPVKQITQASHRRRRDPEFDAAYRAALAARDKINEARRAARLAVDRVLDQVRPRYLPWGRTPHRKPGRVRVRPHRLADGQLQRLLRADPLYAAARARATWNPDPDDAVQDAALMLLDPGYRPPSSNAYRFSSLDERQAYGRDGADSNAIVDTLTVDEWIPA